MKNSNRVSTGLLVLLSGLTLSLVLAQDAAVSYRKFDSVAGLEIVSPENLPKHGTFWSLQRTRVPPLPFNPFPELPVYRLNKERDVFLVDDRSVDYEAIYKERLTIRTLKAAALGMSLAEMDFIEGGGEFFALSYSTNDLFLEITAFTNNTAALVIHPPWNETNGVHDLFYTTNLASPINWRFLMRTTHTNVLVPDLCDQQGFFRLGQTNGALTVTTTTTPQQLAQLLVPPWVTVTNATFTGANVSRGTFAGGHGCGLPIETGVILSSGYIAIAVGTNNYDRATGITSVPPDADLDILVEGGPNLTFDGAVLQFDIVSTNSFMLQFHYIFASEEYPEYIGPYNDPMAIFISTNRVGTNWIISGTNNIAVVPGTTQPVSVNTINGGSLELSIPATNPKYYVDNGDPNWSSLQLYDASKPVFNVQYDGLTVLLKGQIQVSANVTNHIKIAIEDYGDAALDSAVFLKSWQPDSCCQCQ